MRFLPRWLQRHEWHLLEQPMKKLLQMEVKMLARAFQSLMFRKPLPRKINGWLTWMLYEQMNRAMRRHARYSITG